MLDYLFKKRVGYWFFFVVSRENLEKAERIIQERLKSTCVSTTLKFNFYNRIGFGWNLTDGEYIKNKEGINEAVGEIYEHLQEEQIDFKTFAGRAYAPFGNGTSSEYWSEVRAISGYDSDWEKYNQNRKQK